MAGSGLHLADQGFFWVGVEYETRDGQHIVDGTQLYVEYQIPAEQTHPFPVVLIHGGGGQGLDWLGTPDGRPGWRTLLLQRGYAVYAVDRPGHGRSPRLPDEALAEQPVAFGLRPPSVEALGELFAGRGNPRHTQWPGTGEVDDPALAQALASQRQTPYDLVSHHALMRRRGAELLDRIGPAIVVTNSAGGPAGWLMADERPDLVRAVVTLEPMGPTGPFGMPWGLTASPLGYDPPAEAPEELTFVEGMDGVRLQAEPARRLPHLADLPIAVVSGEASPFAASDVATVAYLRQAGCTAVDHLRLGELAVHGNGHLMMMERNNEQVLDVVTAWIERHARP